MQKQKVYDKPVIEYLWPGPARTYAHTHTDGRTTRKHNAPPPYAETYKKLCCRRRTARRAMQVKIMSTV